MPLSLDHVVIAVADLDRTVSDFTALGFTVIRGGEHANGITHNVLVVFADGAYLELIAWKRPDPGHRWPEVFHRAGEGFVDYALLPDDMAAAVSGAQGRGLDIADPEPGGRVRPDGTRLAWTTARSPRADVPFLCADVTARSLRVQEGEVRVQPNGVTGVAGLTVVVEDLAASLARNAALLGVATPASVETAEILGSPARTGTLRLGGGTTVTLAQPGLETGGLARALAARGEGPVALVFRGGGQVDGVMDPALSHGARMSVAR